MHATDLAINRMLGIRLAAAGAAHVVEMCDGTEVQNHVGTIHATAQFALGEAASGEYLLSRLGANQHRVVGILRRAEIKFSRPASGLLRAFARLDTTQDEEEFGAIFERGRASIVVRVEVKDSSDALTMRAVHEWLIQQRL